MAAVFVFRAFVLILPVPLRSTHGSRIELGNNPVRYADRRFPCRRRPRRRERDNPRTAGVDRRRNKCSFRRQDTSAEKN
jgi:hypothetical protein